MFSFPALGALVALGVTGWAVWWAVLSALAVTRMKAELRANRLLLVDQALKAADEQAAKETALRLLDEMSELRRTDLKTLTARLEALQQRYNTVHRLYQDSIAIDGPLASRRVQ
jgi:hypothetical protein